MAGDLSKVNSHEAYNYMAKDSEKYLVRIFKDVDKLITQNYDKKIQKSNQSSNIKSLEIFSMQDSQNALFHQIYDKVLNSKKEK